MKLANLFPSDGLQTYCDMTAANENSETAITKQRHGIYVPRQRINTQEIHNRESESKLNDF
jgi:hypothetical protein